MENKLYLLSFNGLASTTADPISSSSHGVSAQDMAVKCKMIKNRGGEYRSVDIIPFT